MESFNGTQRLASPGSALHSMREVLSGETLEAATGAMQQAESAGFGGQPLVRLAHVHACFSKSSPAEGRKVSDQQILVVHLYCGSTPVDVNIGERI